MERPQIVLDTNVLVSALRSKRGAAYRLVQLIGVGEFDIHVAVPLFFEYAEQCRKLVGETPLSDADVDDVLDFLVRSASREHIFFLWRPLLKDPNDDLVLEVAVA